MKVFIITKCEIAEDHDLISAWFSKISAGKVMEALQQAENAYNEVRGYP